MFSNSRLISAVLFTLPFILPFALGSDLYVSSVPNMPKELATVPEQIQLTLSVYMYFFGLGQLIIGPLADNYGRKKVLLTSLFLFIVGSLVCTSSFTLGNLLAGRALQAFGACGSQVAALSMLRDRFKGNDLIFISSFLRAAGAISPVVAPLLGAFLYKYFGWHAIFFLLALYGSAIFIFAFRQLEETSSKEISSTLLNSFTAYKKLASHGVFLYFCLCAIIAQAAVFSHLSFCSHFYVSHHGLSASRFAILFGLNSCIFMLSGIIGGKLIPHLGLRKSTLLGASLFIFSGISMYLAQAKFDHFLVLFIPFLIASSSAAIMLGASTAGALMPFKNMAGAAAALVGSLEIIGAALIGSYVIKGAITVQPIALTLILLGTLVVGVNVIFRKKLENSEVS